MGVQDFSLVRRLNALLGATFLGRRDLYKVFGYNRNITYDDKLFKYMRQDVAGRIVDAPAQAIWTNPPEIIATDTAWNEAWQNLTARHQLYTHLGRVDRLAGIGRYAILLIGFNDKLDLEQPVNSRSISQSKNPILYLQPYSEKSVEIVEYETDNRSQRFMKPKLYRISPAKDFSQGVPGSFKEASKPKAAEAGSFLVHASRVLHVVENPLENEIFGFPRIERVYNILDDLLKVGGGSAETFWLTANRGMHVDVDKEMELDPDDAKNLSDEIDEYTHQLRRVIRTRGTTVKSLGSDTPDPTGPFNVLISILSGATGIPRRILTGSEAGQLASAQDRANWADRIDERRFEWALPRVLYPLMVLLTDAGALPSNEGNKITTKWPAAFKMSPLENAQTSAQHARSATNFAKAIVTMEELKRGEQAVPPQLDEKGNPIPGTGKEAVPGSDVGDLITIDEARKFMTLDKPVPTYDSGDDISTNQ